MYAGSTFNTKSGRVIGVHQKIDRVARRHLKKYLHDSADFPTTKQILHFEGMNGPDGVKRKSPAVDEPWHFINPKNPHDTAIIVMIMDHIHNLARALRDDNVERASFEAAWLSHAITDGLTPAHHYPLEEKLEELRGGQGLETRNTKRGKIIMPGKTKLQMVRNNWEFWGAGGVMSTHFNFELGVATTVATERLEAGNPTEEQFTYLKKHGYEKLFRRLLNEIDDMKMYDEFSRLGWTRHLADETRKVLLPRIIQAVVLAWHQALIEAKKVK
jgi:hypothetical protein